MHSPGSLSLPNYLSRKLKFALILFDIECPYFSLFHCNAPFHCSLQLVIINKCIQKWVQKCEYKNVNDIYCCLIHEKYCWYLMQINYFSQQQDKFIYQKRFFFETYKTTIFYFLGSFFIAMIVDLEIFIETHLFLYFYNETTSSSSHHQRCCTKKLFLKILQCLQENTCVAVSF